MKNIISYAKSETRSFANYPLNEVDFLIFSAISYYNLENIVPSLSSCNGISINKIV